MQVAKEPINACEVSLQIEVEGPKVAAAVDQAYREFARYVTVPGFRKGKAPLNFVKTRVTDTQLRERTVEILFEPAYNDALQQEQIHPFAAPKVELISLQTQPPEQKFEFKALVPLQPQIAPGEYVGVAVERRRREATDQDVESRLQSLRERSAEFPEVQARQAALGDVLITDLTITPEGSESGEARPTIITLGDSDNIPGLDDQLVGVSAGDEKTFPIVYPEDYPNDDVAGQPAQFHVAVKEVRERRLPELDDEFAKKVAGVDTLEALRIQVRTDLEKYFLELAEREMEAELLDKVVEASQVEYPAVLRESEVDDEVREFLAALAKRGTDLASYLSETGQTSESLTSAFEGQADRRIRRGLVLGEIARRENLLVEDADVDKEIAERAEAQNTSPASMRAFVEANDQMKQVRNSAQLKKVLGFLTAAAIITDKIIRPGEDAEAPEASAAEDKKPRSRARKASHTEASVGEPAEAKTAEKKTRSKAKTPAAAGDA